MIAWPQLVVIVLLCVNVVFSPITAAHRSQASFEGRIAGKVAATLLAAWLLTAGGFFRVFGW